ncbi:MAG: N-acetylmuramoyl-L-alanine amidase, partial [Christensenellaceae bacterium]
MSKVFIGVGHGGLDSGAIGLNGIYEKDINLAIALSARKELERHGVQVLMSRYKDENDSLKDEIKECNAYKPDLAIDFHNNAGGGDGFEAFRSVYGGKSTILAKNIEAEVMAIGQNSRGVKTKLQNDGRDWFGFVRQTNCPAVLCEFAFVDTKDVEIVDTPQEQKAMGIAAAKGILKTLGIKWIAPKIDYSYIWVGKFTSKAAADKASKEITGLGYY